MEMMNLYFERIIVKIHHESFTEVMSRLSLIAELRYKNIKEIISYCAMTNLYRVYM